MKFLVIGGNAAGMSAASRIKRRMHEAEVIVLEKTHEVSYGACGLPFFIAGLNDNIDLIRIRKPGHFLDAGIDLRLGCCVTSVDYHAKTVSYRTESGECMCEGFDRLLIASGASPKVPPFPGVDLPGIFTLKTMDQAEAIREELEKKPKSVVIVGGGYIGLELAEAFIMQKVPGIRLIEAMDRIFNVLDPEFSQAAKEELEGRGVHVCVGEKVQSFTGEGHVSSVITDKGEYDADLVILSIGIAPNTQFAGDCIEKLRNGAIVTDSAMRTSVQDVYAAGDCSTVWNKLLDKPVYYGLATHANKQGRLAGDSMMGKPVDFRRALGTSMVRVAGLEFAKTGLSEHECAQNGIPCKTNTVQTRSHAIYYPNPKTLTIKLCYHPDTHVLLGAQIMGEKEAALRIDVFAVAIDQGMTTEELGFVDLGYAPPFSSVWDAVQIASNASK